MSKGLKELNKEYKRLFEHFALLSLWEWIIENFEPKNPRVL